MPAPPPAAAPALHAPSLPDAALPRVSVVIPCRNERAYIGPCLDSLLAGDYPADRLEVLVVDGASDDGTRGVLAERASREPRLRVVDNPARITPVALNLGIRAATGDVVVRMDAHSAYPPDYLRRLVEWQAATGADNVGGTCRTLPSGDGAVPRAIAVALAHPFGVGASQFRTGVREPAWVDTVPFGCWRRETFARIGLFDEELVRNQDDEFNHRLRRAGGRLLLVPDVVVAYYARRDLRQLARMMYQYGHYKPLAARKLGHVPTLRQLVPPLFVLGLVLGPVLAAALWPVTPLLAWATLAGVALHAGVSLLSAARAFATLGAAGAAALAACFPVMHVAYGAGYWRGVLDFVVRRRDPVGGGAVALSR